MLDSITGGAQILTKEITNYYLSKFLNIYFYLRFPHGHLRNDFKDPEGAKDILEKASNKSNSSRMKACNTNESTSGKNELDEEIQDQIQSIQLPTFSLVIEKSMIDEQVRKLDQEQHRRQYGRFN